MYIHVGLCHVTTSRAISTFYVLYIYERSISVRTLYSKLWDDVFELLSVTNQLAGRHILKQAGGKASWALHVHQQHVHVHA